MDSNAASYSIRRRVFKLFGAAFEIFDASERSIGFCHQKAFRLKEDIRVYTDESKSQELLQINTQQIIDFGASYDIVDATSGSRVGSARRKGMASLLRDTWHVFDATGGQVAQLKEDSQVMALLRRFLSNLIPQKFVLSNAQGQELAVLKVRFNPFVYRMDVAIVPNSGIDSRLVLGLAVLVAAIEGRQE